MQVTIRAGTADDLRSVLRLWRVAGAEPSHTDDLASLQPLVAFDPDALVVAQVGDELVGTVIAGWDGWRGPSTGSPSYLTIGVVVSPVNSSRVP